MARSRNIKPGFFLNDELAEIEPLGRILFAGLWTIADREGRLEDRPKKIKAEILPYDDCDVNDLLQQLNDRGFIIRYEADGRRYIQVVNFKKHQNPHKNEAQSTIPGPEEYNNNTVHIVAPDNSGTSTVQVPECSNTNPADSLNLIPDSLNLIPEEGATSDELAILNTIRGIENYPFDFKKDLEHIRNLAVDFPDIDLLHEVKKWATYKLDKPLNKKSNPRSQLRNWMTKVIEFKDKKGGVIRAPASKLNGNAGGYSAGDQGNGRKPKSRYASIDFSGFEYPG